MRLHSLLLVILGTAIPPAAQAHGDLDKRIRAVTQQIALAPADANLRLHRCELLRLHGEWESAEADLDVVGSLAPETSRLAFRRGEIACARGEWKRACAAFDRAVAEEPEAVLPRLRRARAFVALGEHGAAIADFQFALEHLADPRPENFLDCANAQEKSGRAEAALAALDAGIARLGPLPVLHLRAIEVERCLGRPLDARRRVHTLLAYSGRRERWLALEGELLCEGGRADEARTLFRAALREIDALPSALRALDDARELRMEIVRRFESLQ